MKRPESHAGLSTGERIKLLRERQRRSQKALAAVLPISAKQLGRYERGEGLPSGHVLRSLALALNTTTDYLLGLSDDPIVAESDWPTRAWSDVKLQGQAA